MRTAGVLAVAVAVLLLGGCGAGAPDPAPKPSYHPVPDADLYAQIRNIPGVTGVDLSYKDTFTSKNSYAGEVRIRAGVSADEVLDHTLAILWQGHPGAGLVSVSVVPPGEAGVFPGDLGLLSRAALVQRYGPQPGDGTTPDKPLPSSSS